jgi:hypothetical protein
MITALGCSEQWSHGISRSRLASPRLDGNKREHEKQAEHHTATEHGEVCPSTPHLSSISFQSCDSLSIEGEKKDRPRRTPDRLT